MRSQLTLVLLHFTNLNPLAFPPFASDHTLHQNFQSPQPVLVPPTPYVFWSAGNTPSNMLSITLVMLSLSEVDNVPFPSEVGQETKCLD